ncbi:Hsp20/alpha crystallin family protein [Patescibacteria group bacterium]
MPKSDAAETFAKKIKELTADEIEYTEDFFKHSFGEGDNQLSTVKQSASSGSKRNISAQYGDKDIDEEWLQEDDSFDGQLAVDVFQTDDSIVITSTVAGVRIQDLEIDMNGDMITIRGRRQSKCDDIQDDDYFIRECFWGGFSRSVILPVDVQHDKIEATLENGILTITLPKAARSRNGKIEVKDISS